MADFSIYVKTILRERKITDYLASKGIFPSREYNNRKMYICPIHEGDTSPSMTVFTDEEYEKYYCFGCHSGITIINLVSDMEQIDKRVAFKELIRGLDIPGEQSFVDFTDSYDDFVKAGKYDDLISMVDVEELSLRISVECYNFLKLHADFDAVEIQFFEKVLQKIDSLVKSKNKKGLEEIYYFLVEQGIPHRSELLYDKKEQEIIQNSVDSEIWRTF